MGYNPTFVHNIAATDIERLCPKLTANTNLPNPDA